MYDNQRGAYRGREFSWEPEGYGLPDLRVNECPGISDEEKPEYRKKVARARVFTVVAKHLASQRHLSIDDQEFYANRGQTDDQGIPMADSFGCLIPDELFDPDKYTNQATVHGSGYSDYFAEIREDNRMVSMLDYLSWVDVESKTELEVYYCLRNYFIGHGFEAYIGGIPAVFGDALYAAFGAQDRSELRSQGNLFSNEKTHAKSDNGSYDVWEPIGYGRPGFDDDEALETEDPTGLLTARVFHVVAGHLWRQRYVSQDEQGGSRLRGPFTSGGSQMANAIGCLIRDDFYSHRLEYRSFSDVVDKLSRYFPYTYLADEVIELVDYLSHLHDHTRTRLELWYCLSAYLHHDYLCGLIEGGPVELRRCNRKKKRTKYDRSEMRIKDLHRQKRLYA